MNKELKYTWLPKHQLWDCTDGEIHGGGKIQEEAENDYHEAILAERLEQNIGWR